MFIYQIINFLLMIKKIAECVWKLSVDSNIYFLEKEKTVIDTGPRAYRQEVELWLSKVVDFSKVERVIFSHLHMDHIGNFDLFENARFFASKEEIEDFKAKPLRTTLDPFISGKLKKIKLEELKDFDGIEVIKTPGHTKGSVCLFYKPKKILFSGDTLFFNKQIGRLDLPTSVESEMQNSLNKLAELNFKILAPGHDY